VRQALHLNQNDFCLLSQSWCGIPAMEYALKSRQHLKCLVISNMVDSIPQYNDYARHLLEPAMDQRQLAEVKAMEAGHRTDDPRYMQILTTMHYEQHLLRMPQAPWPEPVTRAFGHVNSHTYTLMRGPGELGASGELEPWDRSRDLHRITAPTLVSPASMTPWIPTAWRRWRRSCRMANGCCARKAATGRCWTTSRPTSSDWRSFSRASRRGGLRGSGRLPSLRRLWCRGPLTGILRRPGSGGHGERDFR